MPAICRYGLAIGTVALLVCAPTRVAAQAFTPPQGVGSVTVATQSVDNTGHRGTDGFFVARGQSRTASVLAEVDYGITDRLSATVGLPYVFAKYTGALPPPSRLPVDECQCWHSSFQDASIAARYRFGDDTWAVTPLVRYDTPSHAYPYQGEAVVGRNLREMQVGLSAAYRLVRLLPKASVQANYTYAFVEKALEDLKIDRSSGFLDFGYAVKRSLFVRGSGTWQRTHGGLRAGSASGVPFPLPGELNTPERFAQRDRILRANFWQLSAGASYALGPADVFASFTKYVWGTDAHNGRIFTFGTSFYFNLRK